MRKLIAAMNISPDGFRGHDGVSADDEVHRHYTSLLRAADSVIYGRILI